MPTEPKLKVSTSESAYVRIVYKYLIDKVLLARDIISISFNIISIYII